MLTNFALVVALGLTQLTSFVTQDESATTTTPPTTQPTTQATTQATGQTTGQATGTVDAKAVLDRFAGSWTIEATWSSGEPLNAVNTYEPTLNGRAMRATTVITLPDGRQYQRYDGLMRADDDGTIKAYVMTFDGSFSEGSMTVESSDVVKSGFDGESPIRETITFKGDTEYHWLVEQKTDDGYTVLMDGTWTKQTD